MSAKDDASQTLSPTHGGHRRSGGRASSQSLVQDLVEGVRSTACVWFILTCLIAIPVMAIAKFSIPPPELPLHPNSADTSLTHDTSAIPFAPIYLITAPIALAILALEVFAAPNPSFGRPQRCRTGIQVSLSLLAAAIVNASITEYAKVSFGELRPDFQQRCTGVAFPDILVGFNGTCTGDASLVLEGRKSFPSGHTSMAASIATFTALYLLWTAMYRRVTKPGASRLHDELCHFAGSLAVFPLVIAAWVGYTRVADHRHHVRDIVGGYVLGVVVATYFFVHCVMLLQRQWQTTGGNGGRRSMERVQVQRTESGSVVTTVELGHATGGTRA